MTRTMRMVLGSSVLALLAAAGAAPAPADADVDELEEKNDWRNLSIVGRAERAAIVDGGVMMEAKVDTGADSTSIDARRIEEFQRDGEDWVRFEVRTNDDQVVTFERKVVDTVTIIGAGEEREERLVVKIALCVGDVHRQVEVNLANREGLEYRLLLGRNFLARSGMLVNVAQAFSHDPSCEEMVER